MKIKIFAAPFVIIYCICLTSCGPSIQYIGKSYPPTTNVDLFFNPADVKKPYETIGKVDGKAWPLTGFDKIQESIEKEAKKRGADAVIITRSGEQVVASTNSSTTTAAGDSKTTSTGDKDNGQSKSTGWNASVTTNTTTSQQTEKFVSADFIRYTK